MKGDQKNASRPTFITKKPEMSTSTYDTYEVPSMASSPGTGPEIKAEMSRLRKDIRTLESNPNATMSLAALTATLSHWGLKLEEVKAKAEKELSVLSKQSQVSVAVLFCFPIRCADHTARVQSWRIQDYNGLRIKTVCRPSRSHPCCNYRRCPAYC